MWQENIFYYVARVLNKNEDNEQEKILKMKDNLFYYTDLSKNLFYGYGRHHDKVTKAYCTRNLKNQQTLLFLY